MDFHVELYEMFAFFSSVVVVVLASLDLTRYIAFCSVGDLWLVLVMLVLLLACWSVR
jgi:hypothetical protein